MSSARFCEAVKKWCSASFSQRLASLQRCIRFSLPGWHRNHVEAKHRGFGPHPTWFSAPFSVRWMTLQQCFDDLGSLLMLTRAKTKQNTHFNSEFKWACSAHCVFSNLLPLLLFDLFLFHFSPLRPEDSLLHQCQDSLLFPRIHLALPQQYSSIFHPVLISCIAFLSHRTHEPPPREERWLQIDFRLFWFFSVSNRIRCQEAFWRMRKRVKVWGDESSSSEFKFPALFLLLVTSGRWKRNSRLNEEH